MSRDRRKKTRTNHHPQEGHGSSHMQASFVGHCSSHRLIHDIGLAVMSSALATGKFWYLKTLRPQYDPAWALGYGILTP